MAVEFYDGTVKLLHLPLPPEAVFDVVDISIEFFNVGFVSAGFPVIFADLFSVVSDFSGVVLDLFLGPLNSSNELSKDDSGGLNGDDLVRIDVNLVLVALSINSWLVDVEVIDSISVVLRSDRSMVAIVIRWVCESNGKNSSESKGFHEI